MNLLTREELRTFIEKRDLLDFASVHTCLNGGTLYVLKPGAMPDDGTLAAIFRY